MSLNGHTYDRLVSSAIACRGSISDVRRFRPDADIPVTRGTDRGPVGGMIHNMEKIIGEIPVTVLAEDFDGSVREARLWVLSKLVGREITSVWDMLYCEVRGINDWMVAYDGARWVVLDTPGKVIKALVADTEFCLLVEGLPKNGEPESGEV